MPRSFKLFMKPLLITVTIVAIAAPALLIWKFFLGPPIKDNPVQHEFVEAASQGDLAGLEKALKSGASVDGYTSSEGGSYFGGPALVEAIEHHQLEAVRWLLNHGANPNHIPADERPLEMAEGEVKENPESNATRQIVTLLKKHGARKN